MAIRGIDTSGVLQSLGMLQQQRQFEEQVRLQREAREEEERRRKRAKKKARDAEKRAQHTAAVTAVGTVAGAVAGSFVGGPAGTGLGASLGGALGTAISGGTVSPGQVSNIGVSAVGAHQEYQQTQQNKQFNNALIQQYSRADPNFVKDSSFSKQELLGMDPRQVQGLIQASASAYSISQDTKQKNAFNSMLLEREATRPDINEEGLNRYNKSMQLFKDAPINTQIQVDDMIRTRGISPDVLYWQGSTGLSQDQMPSGYSELPAQQKESVALRAYAQANPQVLGLLEADDYRNAPLDTKRELLGQAMNQLYTHPSAKLQKLADKKFKPEYDRLMKQLDSNVDYADLSVQVNKIGEDLDFVKAINKGQYIPRVVGGSIQLVDPSQAPPASYQDEVVSHLFRAKEKGLFLDEEAKVLSNIAKRGSAVKNLEGIIAESRGIDLKKDPKGAAEVIRDSEILRKQSEVFGSFVGEARANNMYVHKDVLNPETHDVVKRGNNDTIHLRDSLFSISSLPNAERPIDKYTRASYAKQGYDLTGLKTVGDLKKLEKPSTGVGNLDGFKLTAYQQLGHEMRKVKIYSDHLKAAGSNPFVGFFDGNMHMHSKIEYNREFTSYMSPEELQIIGPDTSQNIIAFSEDGQPVTKDGLIKVNFNQSDLMAALTTANNIRIKDQSGAAVTDPEFERLKGELPMLNDFETSYYSKLTSTTDTISQRIEKLNSILGGGSPIVNQTTQTNPISSEQQVFDVQGGQVSLPDFSTMSPEEQKSYIDGLSLEEKKQLRDMMGR